MQQHINTAFGAAIDGASVATGGVTFLAGATITVLTSSGAIATIYSDDGSTLKANPFTTSDDGEYAFYAANGTYSIEVAKTGYVTDTRAGVVLFDQADIVVALFADIAALKAPSTVNFLRTTGYHAAGVGGALYRRTATTGATLFRTQSADGAWWELDEDRPTSLQLGARADATTGTPTDAGPALSALAGSALNRHTLRLGDNYDIATSAGGLQVGATSVLVPYDRSLEGEGWATKLLVKAAPAVSTLFGLNTDAAGAWVVPFPGELNSKVSEFYIDGRPAAAATLTAFEFGGSYHFHDIHAGGLHTVIKQINQYSDLITVNRVTVFDQPDNTLWAIDLKWSGDGCDVNQLHSFRKAVVDPADALATKALRLRYKVGSTVRNSINGDMLLEGCDGIDVTALHQEDGVVTVQEGGATVRNATFWMRGDSLGAMSAVPLVAAYGDYSSLHPCVIHWSDIGFVYQETFPGGYSTTKHNFNIKSSPYPFIGHIRIDRLFRKTKPEGGLASMGQKYGVSCGVADFDNYSHWASIASEYRNSRWYISAEAGDLPFTDAILDPANSVAAADYAFTGTTGTYYYRAQLLLDKIRKIGISGDTEVSLVGTNGGTSPVLVLTDAARLVSMIRIYRGTSTGSYNRYVDVPLCAGARFVDAGGDVGGYPWIVRGAAAMDAINTGAPASYKLRPGSTAATVASDAYGHCEVLARSNAVIPTAGTWRAGDKWGLINPVTDGFIAFRGWVRKTTGTGHVAGTDWIEDYSYIQDPTANSAKFTTATEPVNATFKKQGRCVYDTTTSKPLWAFGSGATDVWKDATGTTVYTPV